MLKRACDQMRLGQIAQEAVRCDGFIEMKTMYSPFSDVMKVKVTEELGRLVSHNYHAVHVYDDICVELQLRSGGVKSFMIHEVENYED